MSKSKIQKPKARQAAKTATKKTVSKAVKPVKVSKTVAAKKKAPAAKSGKAVTKSAKKLPPKKAPAKKAPVKKAVPVKKTVPKAGKVSVKPVAKKGAKTVKPAPVPATKPAPRKPAPSAPVKKAKAAPVAAKPAAAVKPASASLARTVPASVAKPASVPLPAEPVLKSATLPVAVQAAPKPAKPAASTRTVLASTAGEPIAAPKPPVISSEKPQAVKSGALYYDSHMHTPLCKHAWGEPEEYCAQAVKSGLKGIIFTCHCPMPDGFWPSVRMSEGEFDLYVSLVQRAKAAYAGKLDVCLGIESEFFPGYEKYIEGLHQRVEFDYCLGGLHWQAKEYLGKFEQGTIEGFRRTYFEHLAVSAETGLYDCLAHPDLVKNYHPDSWCFAIIKNSVAGALDRIARTGVAMELNTSGLNKSYSEMNPGNEMLRMMAERKIPVVIGSDAHRAQRVGEHFVTALNNLVEAGYEHVSYFKKRARIDLKISDVISSIKKAADANA